MMGEHREVEELETTRVERLLIVGLVVFLLIGGLWILDRFELLVPQPVLTAQDALAPGVRAQSPPIEDELGIPPLRRRTEELKKDRDERAALLQQRTRAFQEADRAYQFRREELRTAIEARRATAQQDRSYRQARAVYLERLAERRQAETAAALLRSHYQGAQFQLDRREQTAQAIYESRTRRRDVELFALRFLYAGLALALAWRAWRAGQRARWRFLSLLTALLAATMIQLVFLIFRYCWVLLADVAQLGISILGTIACALALIALKRYLLSPERVARARLAGHACPYCSTPFQAGQRYCWDCGRALLEPCPHCGAPHLRFGAHCESCGVAVPSPLGSPS